MSKPDDINGNEQYGNDKQGEHTNSGSDAESSTHELGDRIEDFLAKANSMAHAFLKENPTTMPLIESVLPKFDTIFNTEELKTPLVDETPPAHTEEETNTSEGIQNILRTLNSLTGDTPTPPAGVNDMMQPLQPLKWFTAMTPQRSPFTSPVTGKSTSPQWSKMLKEEHLRGYEAGYFHGKIAEQEHPTAGQGTVLRREKCAGTKTRGVKQSEPETENFTRGLTRHSCSDIIDIPQGETHVCVREPYHAGKHEGYPANALITGSETLHRWSNKNSHRRHKTR